MARDGLHGGLERRQDTHSHLTVFKTLGVAGGVLKGMANVHGKDA